MVEAAGDRHVGPEAVLAAYGAGVRAIERITSVAEWDVPTPCGAWRAIDVVGHLHAVARSYNRLLDAASSGEPRRDLPRGSQLAATNAADLDALTEAEGDGRARGFVMEADTYADRLRSASWTLHGLHVPRSADPPWSIGRPRPGGQGRPWQILRHRLVELSVRARTRRCTQQIRVCLPSIDVVA